jgi:AcrR family transcriptional regulator
MSSAKDDRRVKYTKIVLKESLIGLLQKKAIDKISIKEICEIADINRSTFYAHYSDQYDLLHRIEEEVLQDLNNYLDYYNFKENKPESFQVMENIFEYIVENAELCKVLLGEHGNIEFQKKIMMLVQRQYMEEWQGEEMPNSEVADYLLLFGVNGSIGVVQKWLQSGMKKSATEMAEIITKFTYQGISAFLKEKQA